MDWATLITEAPFDWALIPLDGNKRPIDPETGQPLVKWQSSPGYDIDGLSQLNGCVKAVGLKLGPDSGGVVAVDFDGPPAVGKFKEIFGRPPTDLPPTIGCTSGKPSRGQRFFLVDQDWWPAMLNGRKWKDNGSVCLELRWAGHQSVIAGAHPETGSYRWLPHSSPAEREMATAPDWLLEPLIRNESNLEPYIPTGEDSTRAVAMLKFVDPLQRSSYDDWLTIGMALHHTDRGLLSTWVDWARPMPNFDEAECLAKWASFGSEYRGKPATIRSLHHHAKAGGYKEARRKIKDRLSLQAETATPKGKGEEAKKELPPIDQWDLMLKGLVDPNHPSFEKNTIRRQIRAATAARELGVSASPQNVRATLLQHQRNLIAGTEEKGTRGGEKAKFKSKEFLINNLIALRCLTGIAAFNKVGKTKLATELVASLIHQQPFMGNPEWMPASSPPGGWKFILWWVDQPGADSSSYLKARGLMDDDGTLHPQIVKLYTEEDDLAWDDAGMDRLIQDTAETPGVVLITDSFFHSIQRIHGSDQEPEAGGALIDVQTLLSQTETTHVCLFHSPKETGPVGINAIRGHSSAGGAVSGTISLHFLEKRDPQSSKWVADKENPHRRMVFEGRGPYSDLLIRGDWEKGTFNVLGNFQQKLSELTDDDRKASALEELTEGQRQTLEWVGTAIGMWNANDGVTVSQVAGAMVHPRKPTHSEVENTRKQLNALVKKELLSPIKGALSTRYNYRSVDG
ncbi:hypothetical protein KR100_11935 [Synechococcus sp. KORDI-100]|uniref:bifunctional DNA primase/polymerase n=1 Tax=Synechococcus sp. KORDI-100 TaxID=1280380 RepID=UPI0004E085BB|nr:bifunctional DNA primase/polymerase [Synechococcus sp. KORDI-100]AII44059.1 hypothetical protein KR100_11935 [Synechococcus sp. KORDI-100]